MINIEKVLSLDKDELLQTSKSLSKEELSQLVQWLSEKDDKIRYQSLLLLQHRSLYNDDVYPYWDIFTQKLKSDNSYQRSIGLILIADNAKWDKDNRLDDTIDDYLMLLNDEKPITVRQCIQSLCKIVPYKNHLHDKISQKIMAVNIQNIKETMRKLILLDIINVLIIIRKCRASDEIDKYIYNALTGGILDKRAKRQVEEYINTFK